MRTKRWGPLALACCLLAALAMVVCSPGIASAQDEDLLAYNFVPDVAIFDSVPLPDAISAPADTPTLDSLTMLAPRMSCEGGVCTLQQGSTTTTTITSCQTTTAGTYFGARLPRARAVLNRLAHPLQALRGMVTAFRNRPRAFHSRC